MAGKNPPNQNKKPENSGVPPTTVPLSSNPIYDRSRDKSEVNTYDTINEVALSSDGGITNPTYEIHSPTPHTIKQNSYDNIHKSEHTDFKTRPLPPRPSISIDNPIYDIPESAHQDIGDQYESIDGPIYDNINENLYDNVIYQPLTNAAPNYITMNPQSIQGAYEVMKNISNPADPNIIRNSTSEAGQNLLPTTSKPDISSPKIADTTQQQDHDSLLIKFQKKVAEHPDIQVNANLSPDKKPIAIEIQSLAVDLSQELTPLRDAPGFTQQEDGTYTIRDSRGLDGPIFMSRIDSNGKQCVDSAKKPIFDILHYENGKLNEAKSFIAPDGVPPNSKPTIDPTMRKAVLAVHAKKEQERAILKEKASTIVKDIPYYSTAQKRQSRKESGIQRI
jgi:hypothetical protein